MSERSIASNRRIAALAIEITLLLAFSIASSVVPYRTFLIVGLLFIGTLLIGKSKVRTSSAIFPLFFLYATNCVSNYIAGNDLFSSIAGLLDVLFAYFCIQGFCEEKKDFDFLVKLMFWPVFIGGPLIGSIQMITGRFVFPTVGDASFIRTMMLNANQSNSNYGALTMMTSLFLALYLSNLGKNKGLYSALAIWSGITVLLTLSRGAIIATTFVLLLAYLFRTKDKRRNKNMKDVVFVLIFILIVLVFYSAIYDWIRSYIESRDLQLLLQYKETSTFDGRLAQWKASLQAFTDANLAQKLLGYGDNYYLKLGEYSSFYRTAHNIFFGQLAENGIIGFLCSVILYGGIVKKIFHLHKWEAHLSWITSWALGIMIAYLLISIIGWEFWLAIFALDTYYYIIERFEQE